MKVEGLCLVHVPEILMKFCYMENQQMYETRMFTTCHQGVNIEVFEMFLHAVIIPFGQHLLPVELLECKHVIPISS